MLHEIVKIPINIFLLYTRSTKTKAEVLNNSIRIQKNSKVNGTVTGLPSSKSVSNRALVLNALSGGQSDLKNISEARDTSLMQRLISSPEKVIDVRDAGTTMRFLTAYFSITNQNKILTGTARMKERPIYPLINSLRDLGVSIEYLEKEGYPPFEIKGFEKQKISKVKVPGNLSSQFISAMMMIGPLLPNGLIIELDGPIGSRPYIVMTELILKAFGGKIEFTGNLVSIQPGGLRSTTYVVEPDWSAASYWFSFCSLASESDLMLSGNFHSSSQGDQIMCEIGRQLGVDSNVMDGYLKLTQKESLKSVEWNFTDCPDLAQTVLPLCALKGIAGKFTGLESLRIKETDRILALQTELGKVGAKLIEAGMGLWNLVPAKGSLSGDYKFSCYHDHRMAMGLAPLATQFNVEFDDGTVVNKSYPRYWQDLENCGFKIE